MIYYYKILVASKTKLNFFPIYSYHQPLLKHQIVQITLRSKNHWGMVWQRVSNLPSDLNTKILPIKALSVYSLPSQLVQAVYNFGQNSSLHLTAVGQLLLAHASLKSTPASQPAIQSTERNQSLSKTHPLTKKQLEIYQGIKQTKHHNPQLILGVNGSGKTRIYAELIVDCISANNSALILIPEIGLSSQVLDQLLTYLALDVEIIHFHSQLSAKQKRQLWQKCLEDKPLLVIGPRSAEFLPLQNLALIIIDECHDESFKQNVNPSYNSLYMTSQLAKCYQAKLVCGTATPKVEDYYYFDKAGYPIYRLNERALSDVVPPEIIILEKSEQQHKLPTAILQDIRQTLEEQHQVLIFHNRRGHWRLTQCRQCHWQARCLACQNILIFHHDKFRLVCHGCGLTKRPLSACPDCKQPLIYTSPGTKAIVDELTKYLQEINLSSVPIWRFDSDNLHKDALANKIISQQQEQALIILGTQVISQGLDLPNLQTVIILDAEQSLLGADYRIQERYYQHLHQLSGRVGRGHLQNTKVIIQTSQPDNPILKYALKQDWQSFYELELNQRQRYNLPPFSHLANIHIRQTALKTTQQVTNQLLDSLKVKFTKIKFYPPTLASRKYKNSWEYLIHAQSQKRSEMIKLANYLKDSEHYLNLDPSQLFEIK